MWVMGRECSHVGWPAGRGLTQEGAVVPGARSLCGSLSRGPRCSGVEREAEVRQVGAGGLWHSQARWV